MESIIQARKGKKISLTALIDVVFILLMFFMLTSTFSEWKSLPLPAAKASQASNDEIPALILLYANSEIRVLTDSLSTALNSMDDVLLATGEKPIVLSAEEDVQVQFILDAMNELSTRERSFTLGQPFANAELNQ